MLYLYITIGGLTTLLTFCVVPGCASFLLFFFACGFLNNYIPSGSVCLVVSFFPGLHVSLPFSEEHRVRRRIHICAHSQGDVHVKCHLLDHLYLLLAGTPHRPSETSPSEVWESSLWA